MKLSWLHISDIHMKASKSYDRDIVLNALIESATLLRNRRGLKPDLVFFTGDVAFSGKGDEYKQATEFFSKLLDSLQVEKKNFHVVPGNHDVDRLHAHGLVRTLDSHDDAITYFERPGPIMHLDRKQCEFFKWYNNFFSGIRSLDANSTCGNYEVQDINGINIGILPINTATFCQADDDSGKLWIGRQCLENAIMKKPSAVDLSIALMHHPLEWIHEGEQVQVKSKIYDNFDFVLHGHLHESELIRLDGTSGSSIRIAAGANYQGSQWPNKATYVQIYQNHARVIPIRFDDKPTSRWNIDTSLFPDSEDFTGKINWNSRPVEAGEEAVGSGLSASGSSGELPIIEDSVGHPIAKSSEEIARRSLEQDLFVAPNGNVLYIEPRISVISQEQFSIEDGIDGSTSSVPLTSVAEIAESNDSHIIYVPTEHGGTTLSKRLVLEFVRLGIAVEWRDAQSLPNYRAKLRNEFGELKEEIATNRVLILDNFSAYRHERLINEIQSLNVFSRYIVICNRRAAGPEISSSSLGDRAARILFLWPMSRDGIRKMAGWLRDSADETYISMLVEKVYSDLLALSIPLTPSNVVMYLTILGREQDFHPFNRIDIVDKYLLSALSGASELFSGSFSSREKVDIVSRFSYEMFMKRADSISDKDWFEYCDRYKAENLISFSANNLLRSLEDARILIRYEGRLYFKYKFFFSFFVGRHLSNHPGLIEGFLTDGAHYALPGVVEAVSGLIADGTQIVEHIATDLGKRLDEFEENYINRSFDPLSKAEWLFDEKESEMWTAITNEVEKGPVSAAELDLIRATYRGEAKTADQIVRYQQLKQLEFDVFNISLLLEQALKASHGVRGEVKKRAILACLRIYQICMQIGVILAPEIAKRSRLQWGGVVFISADRTRENRPHQEDPMKVAIGISTSVVTKVADELASKKLGEVFKASISEQDPESYTALLMFGCIVRSKPPHWEDCARECINKINRKAFFLSRMLLILMSEYKTGINTLSDRDALKRLIAAIHAKRGHGKLNPGARLVRKMQQTLEKKGILGPGPD